MFGNQFVELVHTTAPHWNFEPAPRAYLKRVNRKVITREINSIFMSIKDLNAKALEIWEEENQILRYWTL